MSTNNLNFEVIIDNNFEGLNGAVREYIIIAKQDNEEVGYLRLEEQINASLTEYCGENKTIDKSIYIAMVMTYDGYENKGIATQLYKQFGKLYKEKFNNYPVLHLFNNSIADYMFRKLVANGDIPKKAYNEEYFFKDDMTNENNKNWRKLRLKLPKEYQGSEIDWDYEALYGNE